MKNILGLIAAGISIASCKKETITGSGNIKTETRTVAFFNKVQLNGSGTVTVNYAPNQKVDVEGYENLLPIYETYVSNQTLFLEFKNDYYRIKNNNIHVKIESPVLEGLAINGSGNGTVTGNFPAQTNLDLLINGSGTL